ncbi:unnamed protein product [Symbiodinium necroappetens]|uniref:Uncharacterized protein n=1 Tax=Symbiodinium necroappetens TaxID=1628268 RepID=A0A812JM91_9DINO|nr:unnamed protein product [Symbiodinium necroappetens]
MGCQQSADAGPHASVAMVVLLPHSKRPEYRSLKYAYPWAFENLLHTLDNTPDLTKAQLPQLQLARTCLRGRDSRLGAGTPKTMATLKPKDWDASGTDVTALSHEALVGHLRTQVLRGMKRRRVRSQPELTKDRSMPRLEPDKEMSTTRGRNSYGNFFVKESTWEKVGFLGERTLIPYEQKPRTPLPEHLREEMRAECETVHQISLKLSQPRNRDGMIFSG